MKTHKQFTPEEVETIKELYIDHFDYEIAEMLGRTRKSIEGKIATLGLKGRHPAKTILKLRKWAMYEEMYNMPIKALLHDLHWDQNLPVVNGMDKIFNTDSNSVTRWMKSLGVPHRNGSEDNKRRYSTMTEDQIKAQTKAANDFVRKNGLPHTKGRKNWCVGLTKETHPSLKAISENRVGENNPMWNVRGKNHPRWTGGEKYWKHQEWIEIRDLVKERDNYTCQDCRITQEELSNINGSYLNVHHIIPYRVCKEHDPKNLITLCPFCHSKADGNIGDGKWKPKKSLESEDAIQNQSSIFQF